MNFKDTKRYKTVIDAIDVENSKDPNIEHEDGGEFPKELLYSHRMTSILNSYDPEAGEILHIAAHGQHIRRWDIPRSNFPEGRKGYHQWRKELTNLHCHILTDIMQKSGYSKEECQDVEQIIGKKNLRTNNFSQTLQDVVSLVFLRYYALSFVKKHSDKNIEDILLKVLSKMSDKAIFEAKKISPAPIVEALINVTK